MLRKHPLLPSLVLILLASCQSAPKSGTPNEASHGATISKSASTSSTAFDSQIEISYILGHDSHRFTAASRHSEATAQSYLNQELLKQGRVDSSRYSELLTQITGFVRGSHRKPASSDECRGPYTVTVRQGTEAQTFKGCRSSDDGSAFSRITRDAEFLLYSKK